MTERGPIDAYGFIHSVRSPKQALRALHRASKAPNADETLHVLLRILPRRWGLDAEDVARAIGRPGEGDKVVPEIEVIQDQDWMKRDRRGPMRWPWYWIDTPEKLRQHLEETGHSVSDFRYTQVYLSNGDRLPWLGDL